MIKDPSAEKELLYILAFWQKTVALGFWLMVNILKYGLLENLIFWGFQLKYSFLAESESLTSVSPYTLYKEIIFF